MLPGIIIKPLKRFPDERGSFTEVFREDWKDLIEKDQIVQANLSATYPGLIRAWHRHERGQIDYFLVVKGALKICAYDDKIQELTEIISTSEDLQIVKIPGHYWHGIKAVSNEPTLHVYFVNRLYDYKNPDETRRSWNDPSIIPKQINGKTNDPRIGKPWDWLYPPHK
ncbi:MAG TPA: dTDP-4-dehydrorhamnose 3,5-epimerase family protein [Candidatus Bathyarchaeia archaeon]|nr:dTDP-4-dehydrorhamnose 3,5-epimerase family protein [Candidatus Bathyarchaeia archaeon]